MKPNCETFASQGTCSGENVKLEKIIRSHLNETATIEETGYKFINVNEPQPAQAWGDILSFSKPKLLPSLMLVLISLKKEHLTFVSRLMR